MQKFTTAHELARTLLAGPDADVVVVLPVFDAPGHGIAYPVAALPAKVDGKDVIEIAPDPAAFEDEVPATSESPEATPVPPEKSEAPCCESKCGCGHAH